MGRCREESVRCEVPTRSIVWWHMECLQANFRLLAEQEDGKRFLDLFLQLSGKTKPELWICPNCYPLMLLNLIREESGGQGDTRTLVGALQPLRARFGSDYFIGTEDD